MTSQEFLTWLKGSIPGILLLGAAGSCIAYAVIAISRYTFKKLFTLVKVKLFFFSFTPLVRAAAMALRYKNAGDPVKLTIWCITVMVLSSVSLLLFLFCLIATLVELIGFRVQYVALSVSLVTATLLMFAFAVKDLFAMAGVFKVLFYDDLQEVEKLVKNKPLVLAAVEKLLQSPKPIAATPTEGKALQILIRQQ